MMFSYVPSIPMAISAVVLMLVAFRKATTDGQMAFTLTAFVVISFVAEFI